MSYDYGDERVLRPMVIRLGFGNPENHDKLILYFLLGYGSHGGRLA